MLRANERHNSLTSDTGIDALHAQRVLVRLVPELDLGEDLIGEGEGHDEGGVAVRAAEVDEAAVREEDDVAAVRHGVAVDLRLDVDALLGVRLEPCDVDLDVEVADAVSGLSKASNWKHEKPLTCRRWHHPS
jgi:hypothetical protein